MEIWTAGQLFFLVEGDSQSSEKQQVTLVDPCQTSSLPYYSAYTSHLYRPYFFPSLNAITSEGSRFVSSCPRTAQCNPETTEQNARDGFFFTAKEVKGGGGLFLATTNDVGESGVGSTLETPPSNKYIRSRILNIFIFVGLYYTARAEVTELHGRRIGI